MTAAPQWLTVFVLVTKRTQRADLPLATREVAKETTEIARASLL